MATIYDVAKQAGTSISTVSHYLNKTKYVGPNKSLKIKEAIETLSYVPNRAAKALKTSRSNEIHIVLPNLIDPLYTHTFTGFSTSLLSSPYTPILHLSQDDTLTELNILEQIKKSNPAGIVLCSCLPNDTRLLIELCSNYPVYFLYRAPFEEGIDFFSFNNIKTIYRITKQLLDQGLINIGLVTGPDQFSWDRDCINGYQKAFDLSGSKAKEHLIHRLPYQKEAAFKTLTQAYEGKELPACMIASSSIFATAIKDLYALRQQTDYLLITLGYESWFNKDLSNTLMQTMRESEKLGSTLIESLIKSIEHPSECEKQQRLFKDAFDPSLLKSITPKIHPYIKKHSEANTLRLLLLDDATSLSALKSLLPHFEQLNDLRVIIESCPYDQLMSRIVQDPSSPSYDLCSVDMPWLPELARQHLISPLTETLKPLYAKKERFYDYPSRLGSIEEDLYGLPYLIGLQLLFYRKDIFDDQILKESFYARYNRELTPPIDWLHYNQIAEFFTLDTNKNSPTTYGTCLANYYQGSILGEVLPRIWGYGGRVVDEDDLPSLCSPPVKKAFENYLEASRYGTNVTHYAQDVARTFCEGNIAMITSYVSYAPLLYDKVSNPVSGLVDFAPMPSDSSMVSGWSLCLHERSKKKALAHAFFKWFLSPDIAYRYALLTGNPTKRHLFLNTNLNKLYPWLSLSLETFEKGHTRRLFEEQANQLLDSETFEGLISNIIAKRQNSKASLHSLLKQADRDLTSLLSLHL